VDFDSTRGGGVFYKREADKATFTWHQIKEWLSPDANTVQLVLHESGAVDFVYDQVQVPLRGTDLWGLYPGDTRPRIEAAEYLFDVNAYSAPAGTIVVEDFNLLYRRFVHAKIVPLAYMVLGGTLFILGVFPLFFRTSLIKPLEALLLGVRRVDEGDLDTPVPVRVNDEIGILAQNFNRMTASLKAAEDELRAYAEGLEEKVSERTADLRQAQDQLIHAEKMASMGQLTAGIAHEIKNPLNFVNNFAQLSIELADELVEELETSQERPLAKVLAGVRGLLADLKQNVEKILSHGRRADDIVQSMLDHSRSGAGERRAADVNELVEEYADLAYHSMRASARDFNVTIEHDFDESVGKIVMAPREIGRVLLNLLANAFYAVHERALSDDSFSPTVLIRTLRDGTQVEIHVSDNGPGIDETLHERIFEPFFTTKPAGSGAGLGLSLSYDIVTQGHGGTLTVESEEGQGATFIISLPVG
ncbi:MAG: HAMP domain-containing protein, partial [Bacteroidetes bacterium]|nr:HAMP domain-containing protein [Bacteroidota bacterium]